MILVGGSSQIPYIKKKIEENFPNLRGKIINSTDYDKCVAKGAAILGAIKEGKNIAPFGRNHCSSVIAYNLFVVHSGKRELFIKHGVNYPFEKEQKYVFMLRHALDTQIPLKFCEEYEKNNETVVNTIKDIQFYHPCFYTGDKMSVALEVDEAGLYKFTARHEETGERIEFESEKLFTLTADEMNKLKDKIKTMKDIT